MPLHQHYEVTWRIEQNLNVPRRRTLCTKRVLTCSQVLELVGSDARELALRYPASPICRKHVSWYQGRNFQGAMGFKVGHKIPERWRGSGLRAFLRPFRRYRNAQSMPLQLADDCPSMCWFHVLFARVQRTPTRLLAPHHVVPGKSFDS